MSVMRQIREDEPLMIAWKTYQATDEYQSTKNWAGDPKHVDGSLWAAFSAGFLALNPSPERVGESGAEHQLLVDIAAEAQFLCARIDELDWCESLEETARQHAGHVDPPLSRLKGLLADHYANAGKPIPLANVGDEMRVALEKIAAFDARPSEVLFQIKQIARAALSSTINEGAEPGIQDPSRPREQTANVKILVKTRVKTAERRNPTKRGKAL